MNKQSILSQMCSKSLHLKVTFIFFFFSSEEAHPLRFPLSKELSNKNTTLFEGKGTRKWARKNKFFIKNGY